MPLLKADGGEKTAGWLFIYACRHALVAHVESAVAAVLGGVSMWQWQEQSLVPQSVRAEVRWRGPAGRGATLASTLRMFPGLHAEITSEPTADQMGMRYALVPQLGLWSGAMDSLGETMLGQERVHAAMALPPEQMRQELERILGRPWDEVLEPLRLTEGQPATLLRVV